MKLKLLILLFSLPLHLNAAQDIISRVEPPFWWTGFKDSTLQLLVHGDSIGRFEPSVDHPGIHLQRVEQVRSPNYLFLYLDISAKAAPGEFTIHFTAGDELIEHHYELRQKNSDPAYTEGFDNSDAIYLITPDRFANGKPGNDDIEGMGDTVDRSNPGGRHGGDIQGILDRLDYIKDMGFTAIWLNPLLENRMPEYSYHGYSITDFYRVDQRYGSNEDYRELVAAARARGIDVIMDMIVNHIGSGHWWMEDLPTEDWLNNPSEPFITNHEHITEQDPYVADWDASRFSDGWFVMTMPDLNQRNPLLADYLTQNALWWIEYLGLSGIRMDTYSYPDKHYMADWTRRVMQEYPNFNVVGEEWTANLPSVAYWQKGMENSDGYVSWLSSLMDFPLQEAMRAALVSEEGSKMSDGSPAGLLRLYHALANDFNYADPMSMVVFPDNHDMSRIYTQLGEDPDLFRMALAYMLTVRGTPQVYYGTEILMANPGTTAHGVIRSDFPGGWADDDKNAFTGEGLGKSEKEARDFVSRILNWRKDKEVIHSGKTMHFRPENGSYVYFRYDDKESVMVVINKNEEELTLDLSRFRERLAGLSETRNVVSGEVLPLGDSMVLPARSVSVLDLR